MSIFTPVFSEDTGNIFPVSFELQKYKLLNRNRENTFYFF